MRSGRDAPPRWKAFPYPEPQYASPAQTTMKLENKVAVVTGGGGAIGRAIAHAFAQEGADVVVAGRTQEKIDPVARELSTLYDRVAFAIRTDVSEWESVQNLVRETLRRLRQIDILVNNAGVSYYKPFTELTLTEWDDTINTNLKGVFLCCRAVLPTMMERRSGNIINIASIHGKVGSSNLTAHCTSKFAVVGFTQALATELMPYDVKVNAICPGEVDFKRNTLEPISLSGKLRPLDVAKLAVFLAASDSPPVTGSAIDVLGGTLIRVQ